MRGSNKSKRISWASDIHLCQVRLFLSEESPSQVGLNAQDHLQAKTSLLVHPGGATSDDLLPPGFEGTHPSSQLQVKLSQIPVIRWTNPPKIVLNLTWQVVAGEESKQIEYQDQREMRVLEAIYPRPSSIPPKFYSSLAFHNNCSSFMLLSSKDAFLFFNSACSPAVSMDVEDSQCIDGQTPSIPITPIEEEDAAPDASFDSMAPFDVPINSQPHLLTTGIPKGPISAASVPLAHGVESDIAAASAALTNIMKSNEHGNLIDPELLTKILSTPEMIERLVRDYGNFDNSKHVPDGRSSEFSHPPITVNQAETSIPSSAAFRASSPVATQWCPPPTGSPLPLSSSMGAPPTKDVSYYKSLIQQHGGERQETPSYFSNRHIQQPVANQEALHNSKTKESKPKIMKPCIYFNSSRGCRNGANCAYQHDATFQPRGSSMPAMQSSKRMKMDSEISS